MKDQREQAIEILTALGLPRRQQNERSALILLALLHMKPGDSWTAARAPLMGITPIMQWVAKYYGKNWAPNTRETVRRQSVHQFVEAGLALKNPDDPARDTNNKNYVYQIAPNALKLLRHYSSPTWSARLRAYLDAHPSLVQRYARQRAMQMVPVLRADQGEPFTLSPGPHSELIRAIIDEFAPRWAPGSTLVYAGDTGKKFAHFKPELLASLGVTLNAHGKMPDVILLDTVRNWLLLVEAVTSHGPVDGKRHDELRALFAASTAPLVYVTTFPNRQTMGRFLAEIAWETEVWTADAPEHMIHFNGDRYLGPHV